MNRPVMIQQVVNISFNTLRNHTCCILEEADVHFDFSENIKVRFYELDDEDNLLWEDYGKFSDLDVHHQYAIVFK
jgi:hypothetical protein